MINKEQLFYTQFNTSIIKSVCDSQKKMYGIFARGSR